MEQDQLQKTVQEETQTEQSQMQGQTQRDWSQFIYGGEDPNHQSTAWQDPTGFDNICGGTAEQVEAMLRILNGSDSSDD